MKTTIKVPAPWSPKMLALSTPPSLVVLWVLLHLLLLQHRGPGPKLPTHCGIEWQRLHVQTYKIQIAVNDNITREDHLFSKIIMDNLWSLTGISWPTPFLYFPALLFNRNCG